MTAGLEIAGLVLGAIPLLIAALEHYDKAVASVVNVFAWRQRRRELIRSLAVVEAHYYQAFRDLLGPGLDGTELNNMLQHPRHRLWQSDSRIDDYLRRRLAEAYLPFMLLINAMAEKISEIARALKIFGPGHNSAGNQLDEILRAYSWPAEVKLRSRNGIGFMMHKRRVKALVKELNTDIISIELFASRARRIQRQQEPRRCSTMQSLRLVEAHNHAALLHSLLARRLCSNPDVHSICISVEQELPHRNIDQSSAAPPTQPNDQAFVLVLLFFNSCLSSSHCVRSEVHVGANALASDQSIDDVCQYIGQRQQNAPRLVGMKVAGANQLHICEEARLDDIRRDRLASLDHLLPSLEESTPLGLRYALVIKLAIAYLQLGSTPWIWNGFRRKAIHFLKTENAGRLGTYNIAKPLLERQFSSDTQRASTNNPPLVQTIRHDATLVSLALLMLDISSSQADETDASDTETVSEHNAIGLKEVAKAKARYNEGIRKGRLSKGFESAILFCLRCWMTENIDVSSRGFEHDFMTKVLGPLREEMEIARFI